MPRDIHHRTFHGQLHANSRRICRYKVPPRPGSHNCFAFCTYKILAYLHIPLPFKLTRFQRALRPYRLTHFVSAHTKMGGGEIPMFANECADSSAAPCLPASLPPPALSPPRRLVGRACPAEVRRGGQRRATAPSFSMVCASRRYASPVFSFGCATIGGVGGGTDLSFKTRREASATLRATPLSPLGSAFLELTAMPLGILSRRALSGLPALPTAGRWQAGV